MSAPSLPQQTTAAAPARPEPVSPAPGRSPEPVDSADGGSTRSDFDSIVAGSVYGTVRLPDSDRGVPRWLKWMPVLAMFAIGGLVWSSTRPDPAVISGAVDSIMEPADVLQVFTEPTNDESTDELDTEVADDVADPSPDPAAAVDPSADSDPNLDASADG